MRISRNLNLKTNTGKNFFSLFISLLLIISNIVLTIIVFNEGLNFEIDDNKYQCVSYELNQLSFLDGNNNEYTVNVYLDEQLKSNFPITGEYEIIYKDNKIFGINNPSILNSKIILSSGNIYQKGFYNLKANQQITHLQYEVQLALNIEKVYRIITQNGYQYLYLTSFFILLGTLIIFNHNQTWKILHLYRTNNKTLYNYTHRAYNYLGVSIIILSIIIQVGLTS